MQRNTSAIRNKQPLVQRHRPGQPVVIRANAYPQPGDGRRLAAASLDRVQKCHAGYGAAALPTLASENYAPTDSAAGGIVSGMRTTTLLAKSDHVRQCGVRLRQLIDALDISYAEAARDMRVTRSQLGNWLRGDSYPAPYSLYIFCRIRGVNFDWVYLGDPGALPHQLAVRLLGLPPESANPGGQASLATESLGTK